MSLVNLLPFHRAILEEIHDTKTNDLLLLARGLGLRRIICTLMKVYDSPNNLIILVNASPEEEAAIGEELGIMGCRKPGLRVVGYEMGKKDRQDIYKKGGLFSVTSRILVVDMLQGDLPIELITGLLVLHAEKVTALSLEAFIVRLYREKNKNSFLKAFTDQPEHITSGLSPLKNIMKELQLRRVHIYPRFHADVKSSLEEKRVDVIELFQPMTDLMSDIHGAIVQCMTSTVAELKRSNTHMDLDDLNVENAYFRSFDAIVRRQLDPVWHKVGPRTKQLVSDLATLRNLLTYLLTYDPFAFHAYLETIIASNSVSAAGNARQNQSPWLLTDAAHVIFSSAKRRCYTITELAPDQKRGTSTIPGNDFDDEEDWALLDELEGGASNNTNSSKSKRPEWLPKGMEPVYEEQPKWNLLADILREIEDEIMRQESISTSAKRPNTVLVMTSSNRTATLVSDFLSSLDPEAEPGCQGRKMLAQKFRSYLWWKANMADGGNESSKRGTTTSTNSQVRSNAGGDGEISEALRRKDQERQQRQANRRRVRGGAVAGAESTRGKVRDPNMTMGEEVMRDEADNIAGFLASQKSTANEESTLTSSVDTDHDLALALALSEDDPLALLDMDSEFNDFYGLVPSPQTVLVRAYSDDSDDRMLAEIQPKFVVMFEPNQDFVRRLEVYRSLNPGLGVRVYFILYQTSCEEHKYLAGLRKEKDSFENLIKERGSMLLPILEDQRAVSDAGEAMIKTISSRIAGGRKEVSTEPSRIIVDMREFRSTLPSLLHASRIVVIPATLTVGDYVLTPDICVERKSIPDLVSSFNSGRLYTQCELMSVHYKQPILLIEFEEHKSFSLEIVGDMKSYAKPTGKYPAKKPGGPQDGPSSAPITIQSKLVLLTLTFPRLRIIWSSSPYATADIFADLKAKMPEPSPSTAIAVGASDDPDAGKGVNQAAEDLLRTIPGVTAKNVKFIAGKVGSVRGLCELKREEVEELFGKEPGKKCWEFLHWGER